MIWHAASLLFALLSLAAAAEVSDLLGHLVYLDSEPQHPRVHFERGLTYQLLAKAKAGGSNDVQLSVDSLRTKAEEAYRECLAEDPSNSQALSNLASLQSESEEWSNNTTRIVELYERALFSDPLHAQAYINYGIFLRRAGMADEAIAVFNRGLHHTNLTILLFEIGLAQELREKYDAAESIYKEVLALDSTFARAWLNLGAVYHKQYLFDEAIGMNSKAIATIASYHHRDCFRDDDSAPGRSPFQPRVAGVSSKQPSSCICPSNDDVILLFKILSNTGIAYRQLGRYLEAIECYEEVITLLHSCQQSEHPTKELLTVSVEYFLALKAGLFFEANDWLESLLYHIDELDLREGVIPSLKPFDTLSLPVSRQWKRKVATFYSSGIEGRVPSHPGPITDRQRKLRLGFATHDIGNHPTTFLFEGIVVANRNSPSTEVSVYSYGKDDGSRGRQRIVDRLGGSTGGGSFFDISQLSHDEAARVICEDQPDVLFDMNGPTLGARPHLMEARCAQIQVTYLAYPGTSGASYMDYIIVDRHVAAIERAEEEFTEKLAILPRSYQANYFVEPNRIPVRGSAEWTKLRANEGLPTSASVFVFANLNKHDKLDPATFSAMMACLARVPHSVLWLLEPSSGTAADIITRNLRKKAMDAGISPDRLVFAKKVGRDDHIRRMAAGDLFLDTFNYGAHTTATDAMRGGLPLLTLAGRSFSSRVGTSLLSNMNSRQASSLITYSEQEFVDVAVEIATAQIAYASSTLPDAKSIATRFIEPDDERNGHTLFDWKAYSRDLDDVSRMMVEVKQITSRSMHIVLT